jgi:hypothetical protein
MEQLLLLFPSSVGKQEEEAFFRIYFGPAYGKGYIVDCRGVMGHEQRTMPLDYAPGGR